MLSGGTVIFVPETVAALTIVLLQLGAACPAIVPFGATGVSVLSIPTSVGRAVGSLKVTSLGGALVGCAGCGVAYWGDRRHERVARLAWRGIARWSARLPRGSCRRSLVQSSAAWIVPLLVGSMGVGRSSVARGASLLVGAIVCTSGWYAGRGIARCRARRPRGLCHRS